MESAAASTSPTRTVPGAYAGLAALTLINLFNYLDRYIVAALLPRIQDELHIGDTQAGVLGSVFIVVMMVVAPLGGYIGDRVPRRYVVAASVFIWSAATIASGLARSYLPLLLARAAVGVGEGGYGSVAPSILSDFFPKEVRSRILAVFYMAIPVGAAAGYVLGGWLAQDYSWHAAFFVGGAPGLLLAIGMLFTPEPARGASDGATLTHEHRVSLRAAIKQIGGNGLFWSNTIGLTLLTFSMGGLAFFMPKFLEHERGIELKIATIKFGVVTLGAGFFGTIIGGALGDWADRKRAFGGMWVSAIGLVLAVPLIDLASSVEEGMFAVMFVALLLLFLNTGPINASILNSVSPAARGTAMGLSVLVIHLFGDAFSPTAVGFVSEHWSLAMAIRANAAPVLVGGIVLALGAARLARRRASPAAGS